MKTIIQLLLLITLFLLFTNCNEEVVDRIEPEVKYDNPYDDIEPNSNLDEFEIDSTSILGLHTFIFAKKCAIPACHDGTFEPDFRTVASSYNSMVLHPVLKNDAQNSFTFRVQPGDSTASWLYERITTDDPVLGRMPLYDVLGQKEIKTIAEWIQKGAEDMEGDEPSIPVNKTHAFGYLAYLPSQADLRIDTNRYQDVIYYPFYVPQGETVQLYAGIYNIDQNGEFELPLNITEAKIQLATNDPYSFNSPEEKQLNFLSTPYLGPYFLEQSLELPYYFQVSLNTSQYQKGDIVYFRFRLRNSQQASVSIVPGPNAPGYYAPLYSFIVY